MSRLVVTWLIGLYLCFNQPLILHNYEILFWFDCFGGLFTNYYFVNFNFCSILFCVSILFSYFRGDREHSGEHVPKG
jgi:hypothetical protein